MELAVINEDMGDYEKDDILVVRPDGHPWTEKERTSSRFRIVKVSGHWKDFKYLEEIESPDDHENPKPRQYKITGKNIGSKRVLL